MLSSRILKHPLSARLMSRSLAHFEGGKLADGTIFRRPLPQPSIELSSPKGTILFSEALQDGTAKCFFRLMEQLHTQNEPEYCGLATLVTVLNALNVDPHRRWKGNWRFYSEEILECCEPLVHVKTKGIDFDKLATLAKCNGLHVDAVRASATNLDAFRRIVMEASQTEEFSLALAYSRKVLNQTGSGHYSPMGAYHARSDHLLILDCARFKYRPHWVPVPLMFEAMSVIDPDTTMTRGYMKMSAVHHFPPPAAHVLALSIKLNAEHEATKLGAEIDYLAHSAADGKAFLRGLSDILEKVFLMNLKSHGCGSATRRTRITNQLNKIESWDDGNSEIDQDRKLQRKALVLSLDPSFVGHALRSRPDLREYILDWLDLTKVGEELAVEISFTRPLVQESIGHHENEKMAAS